MDSGHAGYGHLLCGIDADDRVLPIGEIAAGTDGEGEVAPCVPVGQRSVAPFGIPQAQRVAVGKRALALAAAEDGGLQALGELLQLTPGASALDAGADEEHGALGGGEAPGRFVDSGGVCAGLCHCSRCNQWYFFFCCEDLRCDFDGDGLRSVAAGLVHGLVHEAGNIGGTTGLADPFAQRAHPGQFCALRACVMRAAADDQHRSGGGTGGGHPRSGVEKAGAGDDEDGGDIVADAGIAIGHIAGGLLVADAYIAYRRLGEKRIDRFVLAGTGDAEDGFYALAAQGQGQGLAAVEFCHAI